MVNTQSITKKKTKTKKDEWYDTKIIKLYVLSINVVKSKNVSTDIIYIYL